MLSERDIDAAHPDAFDFVFGNLAAAKRADFNRHLIGCRYCQAVVDEYSESGGGLNPAQATAAVQLHGATAAKLMGDGAATGRATAHQAGPSWTFQMTVHGLKVLPDNDIYECWWVGPGSNKAHPQLVSGGTFVVDNSGSTTVTMTTGIDPRQFRTMEVTAESPGTGALQGKVLLIGQTL